MDIPPQNSLNETSIANTVNCGRALIYECSLCSQGIEIQDLEVGILSGNRFRWIFCQLLYWMSNWPRGMYEHWGGSNPKTFRVRMNECQGIPGRYTIIYIIVLYPEKRNIDNDYDQHGPHHIDITVCR
jgi:hypothetical protein